MVEKILSPEEFERQLNEAIKTMDNDPEFLKFQEDLKQAESEGRIRAVEPEDQPELTKDNCSPELWEALGGDDIKVDDDNLPF